MKQAGSQFHPPASSSALRALKRQLPSDTPDDYIAFLAASNGGDFWPDADGWHELGFDYLRVDDAEFVLDMQSLKVYSDNPELFVIGSDGGGQWLAYDRRGPVPWPLVMYCPGAPLESNYLPVARSISELAKKYRNEN